MAEAGNIVMPPDNNSLENIVSLKTDLLHKS